MHRAHRLYGPGEKSDSELIREHGLLLDRCARSIARRTGGVVSPEDLWSAGALGLLEAARRFNVGRGIRFESFAEHRVRGAMLDELRRLDHLPRRLRAQIEQLRKKRSALEHSLGRAPSEEELANALEIPLDDLGALQGIIEPVLPIDVSLAIPSSEEGADDTVERREHTRVLTEALNTLPERLMVLMSLHYVEELTYKEIAEIFEVSEPRVCQLHAEALAILRTRLSPAHSA